MDPIVPQIAREFAADPHTIALVASAFAIPYALSQPVLGPLGDTVGKTRIIKIGLGVLLASLLVSAFAPSEEILFASRVVSGAAGGGVIPVAFAILGDRLDISERQVGLSRVLAVMLTALLVGSIGSGLTADLFGWRIVLAISAAITGAAFIVTLVYLQPRAGRTSKAFSVSQILTGYGQVFANPRAKICFSAVFIEGVIIFGFLPYIAILLEQRGAGGIREAGFVLAGMGLGGILYATTVPILLRYLRDMFNLIRVGGALTGIGFIGVAAGGPWWAEAASFVLIGFGFYAVHNSLQTQATELAPNNRGSAVSLHSFFFFLGQAAGVPFYGLALDNVGSVATLTCLIAVTPVLAFLLAAALGQARYRLS